MMFLPVPKDLGEPALQIHDFQLWIHGWESPESVSNWLRATAHCEALRATVWARGPFLQVTDIECLAKGCEAMLQGTGRRATLAPDEPDLKIVIDVPYFPETENSVTVVMCPDLISYHEFVLSVDDAELADIIKQCSAILRAYPIRPE